MKNLTVKIILSAMLLANVVSCKKGEYAGISEEKAIYSDSAMVASDSISTAASIHVKDKQFIKTAEVEMEVKEVYEATMAIEKSLQEMGGFVTSSRLNSRIISEEKFNTSDENAVLVRKYTTENTMQVRVPSEKLGELLQFINGNKIFLNSRVILAEDVTANIKMAELEAKRVAQTAKNIEKIKADKDKVNLSNHNMSEANSQKFENMELDDQLKYSTVDIHLKEPSVRIAEIAVENPSNIDNKYKINFLYDLKNALAEGFYLVQKIVIGLVKIWPLLLIFGGIFYFFGRRKNALKFGKKEVSE